MLTSTALRQGHFDVPAHFLLFFLGSRGACSLNGCLLKGGKGEGDEGDEEEKEQGWAPQWSEIHWLGLMGMWKFQEHTIWLRSAMDEEVPGISPLAGEHSCNTNAFP